MKEDLQKKVAPIQVIWTESTIRQELETCEAISSFRVTIFQNIPEDAGSFQFLRKLEVPPPGTGNLRSNFQLPG